MADNVTLPNLTWTTTNFSVANANQYIRDQLDAYFQAIAGDASVDPAIWQAPKSGTLAARSSVAHQVGRQYYATDTGQMFVSTGSAWRHNGGPGAYDDFVRAANDIITPSKSGHVWTEVSGDWDIIASSSPPVNYLAITAATTAVATLDTGALLDRAYRVRCTLQTHTTQGSIDMAVIVKYADASNYVYVQLLPTAFQIHKVIAGALVNIGSGSITPSANTFYEIDIQVTGQFILAHLVGATALVSTVGARHDDIDHANLAAATKVGFRLINVNPANTGFSSIAVTF